MAVAGTVTVAVGSIYGDVVVIEAVVEVMVEVEGVAEVVVEAVVVIRVGVLVEDCAMK